MDVGNAFATAVSSGLLPTVVIGFIAGIVCVFWPDVVRSFAVRLRPEVTQWFVDEKAHRRFIEFCGGALLLLAASCLFVAFRGGFSKL